MLMEVEEAIQRIQRGEMIIVTDGEDRENEGDIFLPAVFATPENINFICQYARGLICAPMVSKRLTTLDIPIMVKENQDPHATAFTVSVDARVGTTTGISAYDRATTLQLLANEKAKPGDFTRPGHIFPLMAHPFGLQGRQGHTEAAIDLLRLAKLPEVGVICEVMNEDGTMARMDELAKFAATHNLGIVSIARIEAYIAKHNAEIELVATTNLPTPYGQFTAYAFQEKGNEKCHLALRPSTFDETCSCPTVRIHSECLTGDVFASLRCDCHFQLSSFLGDMQQDANSILIYLRQEGRDIGLAEKIRAYALQDGGLDTVEANLALGHAADERSYIIAAEILRFFKCSKIKLVTNNPAKIKDLEANSLQVFEVKQSWATRDRHNSRYIDTKIQKMGHITPKGGV